MSVAFAPGGVVGLTNYWVHFSQSSGKHMDQQMKNAGQSKSKFISVTFQEWRRKKTTLLRRLTRRSAAALLWSAEDQNTATWRWRRRKILKEKSLKCKCFFFFIKMKSIMSTFSKHFTHWCSGQERRPDSHWCSNTVYCPVFISHNKSDIWFRNR